MKIPKYLIWYVIGENHNKLRTQQRFQEFDDKKEWLDMVLKLSKMSIITQLKYREL